MRMQFIQNRIKQTIVNAESVAHLKGFEREILPATDLIKELVAIIENGGSILDIEFKEFVEFIEA
jgi:hypothetical protein